MKYPDVFDEYETLKKIKKGFSIARYGDGELRVMRSNGGYVRQDPCKALSKELRYILDTPSECLIGIPTMDPRGTKYDNWKRHKEGFAKIIPHNRKYYSSLISRPDCGAWMMTKEYAEEIQSLWLGKSVVVVGSEDIKNKTLKAVQMTQEAAYIECPYRNAYYAIDELERQVLESGKEIAIISAGVTATCLAYRLAPKIQAIDLGSIGGFVIKMIKGQKIPKGVKSSQL